MIEKLSKLKYWELALTAICGSVAAILIIGNGVRWLVNLWPQAGEAGTIAYLVVSSLMAWSIAGVFVEAALTRYRRSRLDEALDQIAEVLGKALSAEEKARG